MACALMAGGTLAAGAARADAPTTVTFERLRAGALPPGFRTLSSVEAEPGRWQIVRVGGVAAFSQTYAGGAGYRLAVLESPRLEHLRAGARLKLGGDGDRAAGLAWRVQDERNYYAARLDLADREFVLYKFVRGNRVRLSRLEGLRLHDEHWHELVISHVGDRIKVWLNGIPVASERDDALPQPGMVGFWLPGDSTAHYARLWYESVRKD